MRNANRPDKLPLATINLTANMVDNENADFIILDETHGTNKKKEIEQFHDTYKSVAINDQCASRRSPLLHVSFPQQINEMLPLDNDLVDICAASQAQLNCAKDMAEKIDEEEKIHLDSSSLHPSFESILLDKKSVLKQDNVQVRPLPDPLVCTAREYCEHHVFPTLLPAMQEMLIEAKENKVFEVCKTLLSTNSCYNYKGVVTTNSYHMISAATTTCYKLAVVSRSCFCLKIVVTIICCYNLIWVFRVAHPHPPPPKKDQLL